MSRGLNEILFSLQTAVNSRAMYPVGHPKLVEATDRLRSVVEASLTERKADEITFLVVGEDLVEGDRPIRQTTLYIEGFLRSLKRQGVERLTLVRGLPAPEVDQFLSGMCSLGPLESTGHVVLGKVHLDVDAGSEEEGDGDAGDATEEAKVRGFTERDLDAAQDHFTAFRSDRRGSVEALDGVVWHLMEGLGRSRRGLLLLSPLKGADDRAFVHAVNVSLLVLAQARALGIGGQLLHALGMAALLHDIGKQSLPPEIQQKLARGVDPLSPEEEQVVRRHPELGALHLSGVPGSSTLAVLVAYEHHLRWDGRPSYPALRSLRRPNLGSQLTAIADTYDLARSRIALPRSSAVRRALQIVEGRAGGHLNPDLVKSFVQIVG